MTFKDFIDNYNYQIERDRLNNNNRENLENRIITKYKLKESIKAKLKNLGAEDLADNIFEYIDILLDGLKDEIISAL